MFVPKKAKHLDEAKRFLEFLAARDVAQRIVDHNKYISNLRDVETPALPSYKQEIVDAYIEPGRTVMTMETHLSVDPGDIWKYQQELFAGGLDAADVWAKWDARFAQLMREKGAPGF